MQRRLRHSPPIGPGGHKKKEGWGDAIIALTVDYPATQLTFKFKLPSTKTVTLNWGNGSTEDVIGQDAVLITKISLYTEPGLFNFWVSGDVEELTYIDINSQDFVSGNIDRWAELTNLTFLSVWGTGVDITDVAVLAVLTSLTTLQLSMITAAGNAASLYTLTSLTTLWIQLTDVSFNGANAWTNNAASIFMDNCGFTSTEVDNFIAMMSTCTNSALDITGTNGVRTVASNDDMDTLYGNGNTIALNDIYGDEYQAVYDSWTNKPSTADSAKYDTWVRAKIADGTWANKDQILNFAVHTNADGEALVNWKNPGTNDATIVNAPAFVAYEGFTGNGINQYIDTNFNPDTHAVNYTEYNCAWVLYFRTNRAQDPAIFNGNFNAPILRIYPLRDLGADRLTGYVHNAHKIQAGVATAAGFSSIIRYAINLAKVAKNKTFIDDDTNNADGGVPAENIFILAGNNAGAPSGFDDLQVSYHTLGASLDQTKLNSEVDDFEAYMDSQGTGIIP